MSRTNFPALNLTLGSENLESIQDLSAAIGGLQATVADLQAQVDGLGDTIVGVPIGGIIASGTTTPANFLLCDGSNKSRTTYADLFAAIGTDFGAGDGSTTFGLPEGDRFLKGTTGSTLTTGGSASHTHEVTVSDTDSPLMSVSDTNTAVQSGSGTSVSTNLHRHDITVTITDTATTDSDSNEPVHQEVRYYIRYA